MAVTGQDEPVPAVIVPDAGAWTMWGNDLRASGFVAASAAEEASVLVGPARVPEPLVDAVGVAWASLRSPKRHVALGGGVAVGASLEAVLEAPPVAAAEPHGGMDRGAVDRGGMDHGGMDHGAMDHGTMDHGDMMAIIGEPSEDGLVMEDADVVLGPLVSPLPGGLLARIALDGDVVSSCAVEALLQAPAGWTAPDPLAERTWNAAFALAREEPCGWGRRLAAVEVERALSHLVWLRRLGEILGWAELVDRVQQAVAAVLPLHRDVEVPAPAAQRAVDRVDSLLDGSRRLRSRTRGVAVVPAREASDRGLTGPNARASSDDAGGDAHARIVGRAAEAAQAIRRADRLRVEDPAAPDAIEGPRGPVRVELAPTGRPPRPEAPGATAALSAAGDHAVGLEWSRALIALHSFDVSPWRVGS